MSSPKASEARPEGIQSAPQSTEKFDRLKDILRWSIGRLNPHTRHSRS